MFFPALNSAPDKVELLQQNWGQGAGIQADSSNRRDGVGAWRKAGGTGVEQEATGGVPNQHPFIIWGKQILGGIMSTVAIKQAAGENQLRPR